MKARILLIGSALALVGWFAFAPASMARADSYHRRHQTTQYQWYQGQRGFWNRDSDNNWRWNGVEGDEWYQGRRGHWYQEGNPDWQWRGDAARADMRRWRR